ncbi:APN2 [Candida theae]|uniref:APN2 n=1 Tax=Candida theae TaxID=1198502 RepID=A0AAD5FY29_9ASCO|nr:APN2 [Candida theae]KAI5957562.1 APN2 [Candida theae]
MPDSISRQQPFTKISPKDANSIRFVSFNVNGIKTVFNYHPWNKINNDLNTMFDLLQADLITLQELKLTEQSLGSLKDIGHLKNYRSFISLPAKKKGYSGVGLFVRVPQSPTERKYLSVVKAEEGLSGWLADKNGKAYRLQDESIGGYTTIDETQGLHIDSEGRCVVVELVNNCVVFALYCPANSSATEEGEVYRLQFLQQLLQRCHNLKFKCGKDVIIMGDINVCLDLIDSAEGINDRLETKQITDITDGCAFELANYDECCKFKKSRPARELLNDYVIRSLVQHNTEAPAPTATSFANHFLYDTTRYVQGRRRKLYTVWNTLTSSRQINYGSRIDLILCSSIKMLQHVANAGIWPFILGSDHCPVFTDFSLWNEDSPSTVATDSTFIGNPPRLSFEAKNHFKLNRTRDISTLFGNGKKRPVQLDSGATSASSVDPVTSSSDKSATPESQSSKVAAAAAETAETTETSTTAKKPKLVYTSRKVANRTTKSKAINDYFT